MTETSISAYEFLLGIIPKLSDRSAPRILDFGCGRGPLVAMGLNKGLDIWGADNFSYSKAWRAHADAAGGNRIVDIENGILPFPDDHFDVVVPTWFLSTFPSRCQRSLKSPAY